MIGIYKITSPTGKVYIGSSIDIVKRIRYYKTGACKGQVRLYNSIKKYGWEFHTLDILEECVIGDLYRKENYYGNLYNVLGVKGLNSVLPSVEGVRGGISEITRLKMSTSKLGIRNSFYGKKHSDKTKELIRHRFLGRKLTAEHKAKVSKNSARNNAKIVIDLATGVFYYSAKEASTYNSFKHSTLKSLLNGNNKNYTNLRYC